MQNDYHSFEAWDPLESSGGADPGMLIGAQKREISNILKSYTGYYDVFSELTQNALDAVEKRTIEDKHFTKGKVWIFIDLGDNLIRVTDNGCGMDMDQFKQFLRPNFSFKTGPVSRGSKGVGATYLGYGFNSLHISTKTKEVVYSGQISNGRQWVDDTTGTIPRPKIVQSPPQSGPFNDADRGTAITLQLIGLNIRPKTLSWTGATNATQWLALLRILTPLGGIYLENSSPETIIQVTVKDASGKETTEEISNPRYLYPHENITRSGSLDEFIKWQNKTVSKGGDLSKVPPKFTKLNGLWGSWTNAELLGEVTSDCPIQLRLSADEKELAKESGISIYVYLAFSTDLWDGFNDTELKLRKGNRVLHGGLQLATKHMPQGATLTIPMTNNVGFQNLAHIIAHFASAEPDLGRKGFQPEFAKLAEKISVSAVTAFRRRYSLLRKPGAAKIFGGEIKIEQWIRAQETHELEHSLHITGAGLFLPTEELPIRSEPVVEQDVVALFNQMLSSGLIRGVHLISSSQFNQYDGLYRIRMDAPFDKFIRSESNPLGIEAEFFSGAEAYVSKIKVLEYKHGLNALIEELQSGVKFVEDIGLVVTWGLGDKWREMFDVVCLFDEDNAHHRQIHGTTHTFTHSVSGMHAFEAIILHDLVNFLKDPVGEVQRQRKLLDDA